MAHPLTFHHVGGGSVVVIDHTGAVHHGELPAVAAKLHALHGDASVQIIDEKTGEVLLHHGEPVTNLRGMPKVFAEALASKHSRHR
jgi:hypothetical protein